MKRGAELALIVVIAAAAYGVVLMLVSAAVFAIGAERGGSG